MDGEKHEENAAGSDEEQAGRSSSVGPNETEGTSATHTTDVAHAAEAKAKKRNRTTLVIVGAVVVVLAALILWANRDTSTKIESAAEECTQILSVSDEGKTIILHLPGEDGADDIFALTDEDRLLCVLDELGMPSAVRNHITQTRALDGQQTDEWDDFTARWTYHPDPGLRLVIQER